MIARLVLVFCALTTGINLAQAAPKTAVFPVELSVPALHPDDLMFGTTIKPDEVERLKVVTKELRDLLAATGQFAVADLSSIEKEIEEKGPLHECNGCENDLSKKIGAELAVLPLLQKTSDTLLNLTIAVQDVASGRLTKRDTVIIQGNTEESWVRAVRWWVKRRIAVKKETKDK